MEYTELVKKLFKKHLDLILFGGVCGLVLASGAAFAQGTSGVEGAITEKLRTVRTICRVVAAVIVGIGAIVAGVKFVKGDQDAWGYLWRFGLGAILIAAAGEITEWLGGESFR